MSGKKAKNSFIFKKKNVFQKFSIIVMPNKVLKKKQNLFSKFQLDTSQESLGNSSSTDVLLVLEGSLYLL